MKTKSRIMMVLGTMTIAMVTAAVPLGTHVKAEEPRDQIVKCYTDEEINMLMNAGNYEREQAIELLELACNHAISATK